jgi:hypothetical protein
MRLIQLYLASVASKTIIQERNPALYCYAISQISEFIFNLQVEEKLRENILKLVLNTEKEIQNDILYYKGIQKGYSLINTVKTRRLPTNLGFLYRRCFQFILSESLFKV